ncbi:MAG: hypothetical protein ACYC5H_16215 [Methylovirgula sp.]
MDASVRPAAGHDDTAEALSAGQLPGLALLNEIGVRLGEAFQPEFATPLAATMQRAGDLFEKHDLLGLLDDVLATLGALRSSGLLAIVRDNAAFVAESWQQLQPVALQLLDATQQVPWATLKQDLATLSDLLSKLHAIDAFFSTHLASRATETVVELGELWQRTELDAALRDVAETLGALHRDGNLGRLQDASALLAGVLQNSELDGIIAGIHKSMNDGAAVTALPSMLRTLGELARTWQQSQSALNDANAPKGGWIGLFRILRDPGTQGLIQRALITAQAIGHAGRPPERGGG